MLYTPTRRDATEWTCIQYSTGALKKWKALCWLKINPTLLIINYISASPSTLRYQDNVPRDDKILMTAIHTRLDLSCPLPWPKSEKCIASTSYTPFHSSPIARRPAGCEKDALAPERLQDSSTDVKSHSLVSDATAWIQDRYNETLWLGEHHSSLSSFLSHFAHLQNTLDSAQQTAEALRPLIRSRAQIRQRFSGINDEGLSGWSDKNKLVACIEENDRDTTERSVVSKALKSGAAKIVAKELQESKKEGIGSFGKLWIDAIETRELQLQVMVLLYLLQLNAENPDLFKMSKSNAKDEENNTSPSQVKRRKRKAEKSHRWTGVGSIFPWQMGKPTTITNSKDLTPASESLSDPETLLKQFEGMIDLLCLRVATTNTFLNMKQDGTREEAVQTRTDANALTSPKSKSEVTPRKVPQTPGESPAALARKRQAAGHAVIIPPFGSEGRKKDNRDERDVLQWFCNLIETHFAKALPRQCGTLRSRCFISTSVTPAKRLTSSSRQTVKSDDIRTKMSRGSVEPSRRPSNNDMPSIGGDSLTVPSQNGPTGALQRSLLNEDKSRFQRTQSFAAAKRKSTWDAREVSVRKRWERSQSVGPSTNGIPATQILAAAASNPLQNSKQPIQQPAHVIRRKETSTKDGKERNTFTLVLDTPSKPRPVQQLPIRRKTVNTNSFSQMPIMKDLLQSKSGTAWSRSESQPVFTSSSDSLFDSLSSNAPILKHNTSTTNKDEEEEDFDNGMEILDESLRQAFDEEDDEDEFDTDPTDIFGTVYSDW